MGTSCICNDWTAGLLYFLVLSSKEVDSFPVNEAYFKVEFPFLCSKLQQECEMLGSEMLCFIVIALNLLLATFSNGSNLDSGVIVVFYPSCMNSNSTVIPSLNYTMTLDMEKVNLKYFSVGQHDQCSDQTLSALKTLVLENVLENESTRGLVGLSCSDSAYTMAQLIQRSKSSLKYIHTSLLPVPLADKVKDVSCGLLPPADISADACMALIQHAKWSRVFAMYEHTDTDMNYIFSRFQTLSVAASRERKENEKILISVSPFMVDLKRTLSVYPARVFILMMGPTFSKEMLCRAYKQNVTFPTFQWIVVKTTMEQVLSVHHPHCGTNELLQILQNVIFLSISPQVVNNLSAYQSQVIRQRSILALSDYYNSRKHSNESSLYDLVKQLHGFSSQVYINQGPYNNFSNTLVYSNTTGLLMTENSKVFIVSTDPYTILELIPFPLGLFFIVCNIVFLLVYAVLFTVTLLHRKHSILKTSSLPLLFLCYIGIAFINSTSIIYFIQKSVSIRSDRLYVSLCWAFQFMFNTGATLVLAVVAVKLWRLYRVFVHYLNPGSCLTDNRLLLIASCLPMIDIVICGLWITLDPFNRTYTALSRDNFRAQVVYRATCSSKASFLLLALLASYKCLILIIILFFLFKLKSRIPKAHERLQSTTQAVGSYLIFLTIAVGIPAYLVTHVLIKVLIFEAVVTGVNFLSYQGLCVAYILLPPLLQILKTDKLCERVIIEK